MRSLHASLIRAQPAVWCLDRFQSVSPFLCSIIQALAGATAAVAQVSGQAHVGVLGLAKITSTVLQVGPVRARLHSTVK